MRLPGIDIRMNTPEDRDGLVELWREHGGWDDLSPEAWTERLNSSPAGPAHIVVAQDTGSGKIIGQVAFLPLLFRVKGHGEVKVFRPFAAIVAKERRGSFMTTIAMMAYGYNTLGKTDADLMYVIPDTRWFKRMRKAPQVRTASFPLWSKKLPMDERFELPEGWAASPLTAWDERVDRLNRQWSEIHPVTGQRRARFLEWKLELTKSIPIQVTRDGELMGLVCSRRKGDRQWLICDLMAADAGESLRNTLIAACNFAHHQHENPAEDEVPVHKTGLLTTPNILPHVQELGFFRDEYDFHVVMTVLNKEIDRMAADPAGWYLASDD